MAVIAPKLAVRRQFASKVETTTGTDATVAAADATINVYSDNPIITLESEAGQRQGMGSASQLPQIHGKRQANLAFDFHLVGAGASGEPAIGRLLKAAGFALVGATYSPTSDRSTMTTLTCAEFIDGLARVVVGVALDLTFNFVAGQPVVVSATGAGAWNAIQTDTALLSPTYLTTKPPRWAGATFTIGGTTFYANEMTIALNNAVVVRESATTASGIFSAVVATRDITVTISPEATSVASKDWDTTFTTHVEAAIVTTLGSDANNTFTITILKAQLRTPPQEAFANGKVMKNLTFQANRNASAGDDELTIAYS